MLEALGIPDWRHLNQDHFMALVGMLEKMDLDTKSYVQKQIETD